MKILFSQKHTEKNHVLHDVTEPGPWNSDPEFVVGTYKNCGFYIFISLYGYYMIYIEVPVNLLTYISSFYGFYTNALIGPANSVESQRMLANVHEEDAIANYNSNLLEFPPYSKHNYLDSDLLISSSAISKRLILKNLWPENVLCLRIWWNGTPNISFDHTKYLSYSETLKYIKDFIDVHN